MRISDWSSDVCSSDLGHRPAGMCGIAVHIDDAGCAGLDNELNRRQGLRKYLGEGLPSDDVGRVESREYAVLRVDSSSGLSVPTHNGLAVGGGKLLDFQFVEHTTFKRRHGWHFPRKRERGRPVRSRFAAPREEIGRAHV